MFDHTPYFAGIAARPVEPGLDKASAAQQLNNGVGLRAYCVTPLTTRIAGVEWVETPEEAEVTLVIHRDDPAASALDVEARTLLGQRIALVDMRYDDKADHALIEGLLSSTAYIGNLAAYEQTVDDALLVAMVPIRSGLAHRMYLAQRLVQHWAWNAHVRRELLNRFGETITPQRERQALEHARVRMGAYLARLHTRGLRFFIRRVGFKDNQTEGMWVELVSAANR